MEVPGRGVKSELQPPAHTTATATQDLSGTCDLHHSSWHQQILNSLREARELNMHPREYQSGLLALSHNGYSQDYLILNLNLIEILIHSTSHNIYVAPTLCSGTTTHNMFILLDLTTWPK